MTKTDRKVTRVTTGLYPEKLGASGRAFGVPRSIALTILPGDTLSLKMFRRSQREYISIEEVYNIAKQRRVRSEAAQKLNFKRRSR